MRDVNPVFNNQINLNENTTWAYTSTLKKQIVKQLEGKKPEQQEQIIETLLKLLDVNLLASLYMAYGTAEQVTIAEIPDLPGFLHEMEDAMHLISRGIGDMRTELATVLAQTNERHTR